MRLTELLIRDARTPLQRLGFVAFLAGASSTVILAVVNSVATDSQLHSGGNAQYVALYGLALLVYIFSQRYVLNTTTDEVERIVDEWRRRLIRKLAASRLVGVEKIGHGAIFTAINADTQTVSHTAGSLILGVQAVMMILCTAVYIATLSLPALGLVVVVLLLAARVYARRGQRASQDLRRAHEEIGALHEMVEALLGGFKEIKLSSRRAAELLDDAVRVSSRTAHYRSLAQRTLGMNFVFSQAAIFVLLGSLVFILPVLSTTFAAITVKVLTAVLFLVGPVSGVISAAPQITVANAAAENLLAVEKLLDDNVEPPGTGAGTGADAGTRAGSAPASFDTIELRHAVFTRGEGSDRFTVGPVDLSIRRGETLFITGGNGSGKTTLVKLLTGLYPLDSGSLVLDGQPVDAQGLQGYRDLFGAIFSDFHLFRTLYGLDPVDSAHADALIDEMEIESKVHIEGGRRFSTVGLSTGQRKRLALVAAQLEGRPVLVLDEWAADQDPHFRAKFYEVLLPRLQHKGVTVIAITHDDRYFHHADRRVHIEDGRIASVSNRGSAS